MSDPLQSPAYNSNSPLGPSPPGSPSRLPPSHTLAPPPPSQHHSSAAAADSTSARNPSPLRQSAHIRFEDDPTAAAAGTGAHSRAAEVPTGPLVEVENEDQPVASPLLSPILLPQQQPQDQQRSASMSVMRETRNYGSTLSVSDRRGDRDGSVSPSAPTGSGPGRHGGPGRIDVDSLSPGRAAASLGSGTTSPAESPRASTGGAPGKRRAFSFKKRAPSLGALPAPSLGSSAGGAGGQGQRIASGARKLLNRASLGYFGNDSTELAAAGRDRTGTNATSPYGASGGGGARIQWRDLRRTQTLSVHQQQQQERAGMFSPLNNPDAYNDDDGYGYGLATDDDGKPRIPQMLPSTKPDPDSTPIPTLPFVVLCVMIFGEFSSAGVAGPFLFFMINEFKVGGEAEVGFWAGIVSAVFFFAQFLTSMLWASVANKHGRRVVLLVSLVGNCASLILFGTSTNLRMAIAVRLTQGLFNGAVGVAKGAVRDLTDSTNEARAYGIMGFCWGMGGIIGPILGGVLEHPVEKYPAIFGKSKLFAEYPYLLPCLITACSTGLGAILTLFLGRDGGPRSGVIALPEKDAERAGADAPTSGQRVARTAAANVGSFGRSAGKRISGYFSSGAGPSASAAGNVPGIGGDGDDRHDGAGGESNISLEQTGRGKDFPRTFTQQRDWETGGPPSPAASDVTIVTRTNAANDSGFDNRSIVSRAFSRTSARRQSVAVGGGLGLGGGSAYGYGRRPSRSTYAGGASSSNARTSVPTHARRDASATPSAMHSAIRGGGPGMRTSLYAPDFEDVGAAAASGLSFAQRFLLANDDAVLSLTDLWVAAAIGEDGVAALDEDVFYDDEEYDGERVTDEDGDEEDEDEEALASGDLTDEGTASEDDDVSGIGGRSRAFNYGPNEAAEDSPLLARRPLVPSHFANRKLSLAGRSDAGASGSAFSSDTRRRKAHARRSISQATGSGAGQRPRSRSASRRGRAASSSTAAGPSGGAGPRMPLLYAQAGVEIPHGASPIRSPYAERLVSNSYFPHVGADQQGGANAGAASNSNFNPALAGIPESHSVRNSLHAGHGAQAPQLSTLREGAATSAFSRTGGQSATGGASAVSIGAGAAPTQSVWALLPLAIVAQYGLMSWHSSTFDQVFMAFLVTDVKSGGLGLTAAHFAELIAAMAVCQMVFQFHFYPTVGPPRGKYTHLTMFRFGLALYLPCYTLFPWLRNFITSTDITVMSGMILFASLRWLANVTAFTAVTVLMNAMTPPHLIPLTNGLAQTVSSFMRCVGPIVGGIVWAQSIDGGPDAHSWPFNYHLGFWVVGIVGFLGFLHSLTIR